MSAAAVLLVVHTGRRAAVSSARELADRLVEAGVPVRVLEPEAKALGCDRATVVPPDANAAADTEIVVALGGDGTLLRAAEFAREANTPLLGVNLGHIGFLAEAERTDLESMVERILASSYDVEERMTLDLILRRGPDVVARNWALNDVTVEKAARQRMIDLMVEVDGRPLLRCSGDGLVCATPTGSTAYAFSAGGPVVWPSVRAILVVPISAHALFSRPLVVAPGSCVAVELPADGEAAIAFCDGRRTVDLSPHDRLEVRSGAHPIRLVRLTGSAFTDRLVSKFHLPVRGWRGRADEDPLSSG